MKREWLIKLRTKKKLSQEDMAKFLDVTQCTYSTWELGTRNPKPSKAKMIAKILNFDWTKFYM